MTRANSSSGSYGRIAFVVVLATFVGFGLRAAFADPPADEPVAERAPTPVEAVPTPSVQPDPAPRAEIDPPRDPELELVLGEEPLLAMNMTQDRRIRRRDDLDKWASLAVRRGLAYLAARQNEDGSWSDKIGRKVHNDYRATQGKHVGVTALACMAFLANGSLPGRGEYADEIEKGVDYLLKNVQTNGYITNEGSRMYSHAFATLVLAEVYGMTGIENLGAKLERAIGLIVQSQTEQGGWRYLPGQPDADMSITVCQVMALRAANNAGVHVPKATIDRAIRYVRDSFDPTQGGFRYQIQIGRHGGVLPSRTTVPLTAAGITALYGAGVYDDPKIDAGFRYISRYWRRFRTGTFGMGPSQTYDYYYGVYYGTQAAFQRGGETWRNWHDDVWRQLLEEQNEDGSWRDLVGPNYATSMACVVLQIPYQYLPIFER